MKEKKFPSTSAPFIHHYEIPVNALEHPQNERPHARRRGFIRTLKLRFWCDCCPKESLRRRSELTLGWTWRRLRLGHGSPQRGCQQVPQLWDLNLDSSIFVFYVIPVQNIPNSKLVGLEPPKFLLSIVIIFFVFIFFFIIYL